MKRIITSIAFICVCKIAIAQTPRITFKAPIVYPEGVAYNNSTNMFFVSSARLGNIGTVDANGNYKVFFEGRALKSSYGMKVDNKQNKLWVCTGDPNHSLYKDSSTFKKMIRLIALDLNTGKKTDDIDLSKLYEGKHFANDLAFDDAGNIYITDSYSPVIYKVDKQGKASVIAQSNLFKGEDVGLNGIVYNAKGFLLVINNSTGALLKVDVNNPQNVTKVKLKNFFIGGDGLLWDEQNNLVLIQNKGVDKAFQLMSTDNWNSAEVKAATAGTDRFQNPSTGALQNGKIYLVNSKLNEIDDPTKPPSKEFSLQLVQFKPAK